MKTESEISERQRKVITELNEARALLRMRDKQFHGEFLPGNYWTWLNAQRVVVMPRVLDGYENVLPIVREEAAAARAIMDRATRPIERTFHPTKHTRLVEGALRAAMRTGHIPVSGSGDRNVSSTGNRRIILVLGPTGAGKTALRDHLALKYGSKIVRATESARTNFAAVHLGIQQAFGSVRNWSTRIDLEQHTFNLLNKVCSAPASESASKGVPVILYDESLRWGPHGCNIAVDINDLTPAVQIIFALPEIVDRLSSKSFAESSQMMRRVMEVVELGELCTDDVRPFLDGLGLNGATGRTASELAKAATEYGRFDFVERVRDAIALAGVHDFDAIAQIIADEREAIRVQRMTEKLRFSQEARRRRKSLRFSDRVTTEARSHGEAVTT